MGDRGIFVTILCCLVILATVMNLSMFLTNRLLVRNQQQTLINVQQQITNRDRQVQQLIGQLKASKTLKEVKEVLGTIQ